MKRQYIQNLLSAIFLTACTATAIPATPATPTTTYATQAVFEFPTLAPTKTYTPSPTSTTRATSTPTPAVTETVAASTSTPMPFGEAATVVKIIDGDTVDVDLNGNIYRVRYIGIDAPERDDPCYREATQANSDLVAGQTVLLVKDKSETDQYGRLLRYVYVGDTFVNGVLVQQGWALAKLYRPDTSQHKFLEGLEDQARAAGIGCYPTGVFDTN